ncbi:VWA domain-containing protein [Actinomycetospora lutea]|uniref:vWA domain-containing protein n=1 Tax=Actinomycetospora lutea TaxID=663604 RepID=UPI002365D619|nr:VWA domain-containing protein [Actinomycetospora lutea]MDD7942831.1 VWA domain-containing protein [Actinomycetospora lutea]
MLDRSNSMAGAKLEQAKIGADWFVDGALDGDGVALVSYASAATVDSALHPLTADRSAEHAAIDGVAAAGQTSIGGGLRRELDELSSPAEPSSMQAVVLLTDGQHNAGEPPGAVLPDLRASLTRVYTVGIGPTLDDTLLQGLADATGGEFARIDPDLPADEQAFAIRAEIERLTALARDGGGVAAGSPERLASGERRETTSIVEPGATLATFLVSRRFVKDDIDLEVTDPSGRVLTSATTAPDVRVIAPERPYTAIQVRDHEPGTWRTTITCRNATRPRADLLWWTFVVDRDLVGALHVPHTPVRPGGRVVADLAVSYGRRLAELRILARLTEHGSTRPVVFRPGTVKAESDGMYRASFTAPNKPGVYRLEAEVTTSPSRTRFALGEEFTGPDQRGQIPRFARLYSASIVVA